MKDFYTKRIVRKLDLRAYAPEMATEIYVWVNPPKAKINEYDGLAQAVRAVKIEQDGDLESLAIHLDELGKAQMEWIAEIWSQGPEESHWSIEEVTALVEHAADTDPALWAWLVRSTLDMIVEHRAGQKKG